LLSREALGLWPNKKNLLRYFETIDDSDKLLFINWLKKDPCEISQFQQEAKISFLVLLKKIYIITNCSMTAAIFCLLSHTTI